MLGWISTTFAALSIAHFRVLWASGLFSLVAFFMAMITQSIVAFELAGTNRAVGWVVFAQGAAMALLGPLGGAYADRLPKRRVVATGTLTMGCAFGAIGLLISLERLLIVHLSIASFLVGSAIAFSGPARQALTVELVPAERRGNAMALNSVANTVSRVLGPALAGIVLGWRLGGPALAYAVMSAFYLVSTLLLLPLPHSRVRVNAAESHVFSDMLEGWRYVWSHRALRLLVLYFVSVILLGFSHVTVLPGLVKNGLGLPATDVSMLMVASAVGALIASVGVARFADSGWALFLYSAMAFLFCAGLLGVAFSASKLGATAAMFVTGLGNGGFQTLNGAVIAQNTEPQYMGRVFSLTMTAFAAFGLMALPMGILADTIGERGAFMAMGASVGVVSIVMATALARSARTAPAPG
jgi:MFS family permease